jgi:hypothetical protein
MSGLEHRKLLKATEKKPRRGADWRRAPLQLSVCILRPLVVVLLSLIATEPKDFFYFFFFLVTCASATPVPLVRNGSSSVPVSYFRVISLKNQFPESFEKISQLNKLIHFTNF